MNPPAAQPTAWTRSIPPEQAAEPLRALFECIRTRAFHGRVSHLWQALAPDSAGLEATYALYRALMDRPEPLTPAQAELIALVVSATNGCGYCVAHHGDRAARALGDEPLARAVALDYRSADLTARDRVLLDFAVALTCEPSERKLEDLDRVREYGFDDLALLKATEIVALYNLVNRLVSSLGVTLEDGIAPWEFGAQK